jgi:hypothetical protein
MIIMDGSFCSDKSYCCLLFIFDMSDIDYNRMWNHLDDINPLKTKRICFI